MSDAVSVSAAAVGVGAPARRRSLATGLTWAGAYQLASAGLGFAGMLLLVRVISPADYGRYAAVLAMLSVLNAVNAGALASHAIQLPEDERPDWSLYWSAGLYVQLVLALVCNGAAALCWTRPAYRSLAPLLHVASIGLVLDWPAQLRIVMLRRALDVRRLKILLGIASAAGLVTTLAVALAGGGAYALVLGANVVQAVPFAADLHVSGWRPDPRWWRWPGWGCCRAALVFGAQQTGSTLLLRGRAALEGFVLAATVGYGEIGLLNRARALFALAVDRPSGVIAEVAYPFLPRAAADPQVFARRASLFIEAMLLVTAPAAFYVALEGSALSRVLYGDRWLAADALIVPAAIGGAALAVSGIASSLVLASNRLRRCAAMDALGALLASAALVAVRAGGDVAGYAWALAVAQIASAFVTIRAAAPLSGASRACWIAVPPIASSAIATGAVLAARWLWPHDAPSVAALLIDTATYAAALGVAFRTLFPHALGAALAQVPSAGRVPGWLGIYRGPGGRRSR